MNEMRFVLLRMFLGLLNTKTRMRPVRAVDHQRTPSPPASELVQTAQAARVMSTSSTSLPSLPTAADVASASPLVQSTSAMSTAAMSTSTTTALAILPTSPSHASGGVGGGGGRVKFELGLSPMEEAAIDCEMRAQRLLLESTISVLNKPETFDFCYRVLRDVLGSLSRELPTAFGASKVSILLPFLISSTYYQLLLPVSLPFYYYFGSFFDCLARSTHINE